MNKGFYERYVKLRDKNHMTDYYVSQKTGISRAAFTQWKHQNTTPTRRTIDTLAQFFGVNALVFYED